MSKCPKCNKAVYQAEEIKTHFAKYHPACFVCNECNTRLTQGKQKEKDNGIYCEKCFNLLFPVTGSGAKIAQPGSGGVGNKCAVCNKAVFQAEEIKTQIAKYHPACFVCYECKSHLTLGKQKEKDNGVYCEKCYNLLFPVTGSGAKLAQPGSVGVGDKCPVCNKAVFQAEEIKTQIAKYHPACFVCYECKLRLTLGKQKEKDNGVYCEKCYNLLFPVTGHGAALAQPGSVGVGDKCPVCNKAVFQAEEIKTQVAKYHPACFVCYECKSHLTLGKQKEKDNSVYCEKCFNLLFPVTGLGTAIAQPGSVGVGDKCALCDKVVFQAEEVRTEYSRYHPACFVCNECKTHLTLGKQKEKEHKVYCERCYNGLFRVSLSAYAPKGPSGAEGSGDDSAGAPVEAEPDAAEAAPVE